MLKLNETPIRTANNFRINNIEIDAQIPEIIPEFENVQIIKENSEIDENVSNRELVFGNNKELENMFLRYCCSYNSGDNYYSSDRSDSYFFVCGTLYKSLCFFGNNTNDGRLCAGCQSRNKTYNRRSAFARL